MFGYRLIVHQVFNCTRLDDLQNWHHIVCLSPSYPNRSRVKQLTGRPIAASARLYCRGQLLQPMFSGSCRVCLASYSGQMAPYAALALGRDGANNLASSRRTSRFLETLMRVERTPYSVFDSTKRPNKYRDTEKSVKHQNIQVARSSDVSILDQGLKKLAIIYAVAIWLDICINHTSHKIAILSLYQVARQRSLQMISTSKWCEFRNSAV